MLIASKYITSTELETYLNAYRFDSLFIKFSLQHLDDLKKQYFIKSTDRGFTLYAPKIIGKGERVFANFFMNKEKLEIRFLYHGSIDHPNVEILEEYRNQKNGKKLAYLCNVFKSTLIENCDDMVKYLMGQAYDVIHECRHDAIKEAYQNR